MKITKDQLDDMEQVISTLPTRPGHESDLELIRLARLGRWAEKNIPLMRAVCDDWDLKCEDDRGHISDLRDALAALPKQDNSL